MVDRVLIDGNSARIIVSKAGFNATLGMADVNKIFDSDWFFTGQVVTCGFWSTTFPASAGNFDIMFPKPLSYVPSAMVYNVLEATAGWNPVSVPMPHTARLGTSEGIDLPYFCMNDRLRIPYPAPGGLNSGAEVLRSNRQNGLYVVIGV